MFQNNRLVWKISASVNKRTELFGAMNEKQNDIWHSVGCSQKVVKSEYKKKYKFVLYNEHNNSLIFTTSDVSKIERAVPEECIWSLKLELKLPSGISTNCICNDVVVIVISSSFFATKENESQKKKIW